jgi:methionyl-tRNA synthetase
LLDMLGAAERSYAALADRSWLDGAALQPPSPIFPRLELAAGDAS